MLSRKYLREWTKTSRTFLGYLRPAFSHLKVKEVVFRPQSRSQRKVDFKPSALLTSNSASLSLNNFCQVQEFGLSEIRDLKKDGRNIPVTEENKKEYVKLVCQMKMTGAITKQIESFLAGFYDIIPKRLISIFDEQELELLISGLPNIDLDDLKANTEYHKYTESSLQV